MANPVVALTRGAALVTINTASPIKFYTKEPITAAGPFEFIEVGADAFGVTSKRVKNRLATINVVPSGKFAAGLWCRGSTALGARIADAAGNPDVLIQPLDTNQKQWRFYNCCWKLPSLIASSTKTIVGGFEIMALGKKSVLPGTAESLCKRETNTFNDTSYADSDNVLQPYAASWGAVLTDIDTKDGWQLDFPETLNPVLSDTYGIVDFTMDEHGATAKCIPRTITEDAVMSALGTMDRAIGAAVDTGETLTVSASGVTAVLYNMLLERYDMEWGRLSDRVKSLEFVARKKITTGALTALYSIS
jgi:hypothetical protein